MYTYVLCKFVVFQLFIYLADYLHFFLQLRSDKGVLTPISLEIIQRRKTEKRMKESGGDKTETSLFLLHLKGLCHHF